MQTCLAEVFFLLGVNLDHVTTFSYVIPKKRVTSSSLKRVPFGTAHRGPQTGIRCFFHCSLSSQQALTRLSLSPPPSINTLHIMFALKTIVAAFLFAAAAQAAPVEDASLEARGSKSSGPGTYYYRKLFCLLYSDISSSLAYRKW